MTFWFERHRSATSGLQSSIDRALIGGFSFRQSSFAFASAYQSAMESMFKLDGQMLAALCHTEKGVKKPREMQTALSTHNGKAILNGTKSFVSGGTDAQVLFISAVDKREISNAEQAPVRIIKLEASRAGIRAKALPTLPFVPELSHAALSLNQVTISEEDIIDGDGYTDAIKPFRSEEDIHILAALTAQRLRIALDQKQPDIAARLISLISATKNLETAERNAPSCHVQLAGIKASFEDIVALQEPLIAESMPAFKTAWERDKALLSIAEKAQSLRTKRAWHYFLGDDFFAAD
jgi:acyl-CoA dehydrogenase